MKRRLISASLLALTLVVLIGNSFAQDAKKPNIVSSGGDDIGMWNVGVYTHGMMGSTPNIDSIASVAYLTNLLMDPMEKITPDSEESQYEGGKFMAAKLWAPTAAGPFLAAHLKSLQDYPPRQGADTLSRKKAIDGAMKKLESFGRQ